MYWFYGILLKGGHSENNEKLQGSSHPYSEKFSQSPSYLFCYLFLTWLDKIQIKNFSHIHW